MPRNRRNVLALFRNNHISTAFILPVYSLLLHLPAIAGWIPVPEKTDDTLLFDTIAGVITATPLISGISAALLVSFQGLLLNNLVDEFRLMNDRNWFPGAFYVLSASLLPDFQFFSAPLLAATFCIPALGRLYRMYKLPSAPGLVFDTALFSTLSSLIYPPALWLVVAAYIAIFSLRSFPLREQVIFWSGVLVPIFLGWVAFFWSGKGGIFRSDMSEFPLGLYRFSQFPDTWTLLKWSVVAVLCAFSVLNYTGLVSRKTMPSARRISATYWFLMAVVVAACLQTDPHNAHFILLAPSLGLFLGLTFQTMRNRTFSEIAHLCLIGLYIFLNLFPFLKL